MRIPTRSIIFIISALLLTACGGGGSSDSGGGSGSTPNDGSYNGSMTLNIATTGYSSTETIPVRFTFSGDKVTVHDGPVSGSAKYQGNTYKVTLREKGTEDGVTCDISLTFSGSVGGGKTSGNISGGGPCSSAGVTLQMRASGPYSANRSGNAKAGSTSNIVSSIANRLTF